MNEKISEAFDKFKEDYFSKEGILLSLLRNLSVPFFIYSFSRVVFFSYNQDLFPQMNFSKFMYLLFGGLQFDITAILYINLAIIIPLVFPFPFKGRFFNKIIKITYLILNAVMLAVNSYDITFYPFTLRRTTATIFKEFKNESNILGIFIEGAAEHWIIVLMTIAMFALFYKSYKTPKPVSNSKNVYYYLFAIIQFIVFAQLIIIGIRGGLSHSTRPVTLSNAAKYIEFPREMNIVLNTPFSIFRTIGKSNYATKKYIDSKEKLESIFTPIHDVQKETQTQKYDNVVIFILESFGKEFSGKLNPQLENGNYKGYTPFLDSLMSQSTVYWNTFANGKKSIDAMPSILASIPSIKTPYVLSPYSTNKIDGIANCLNREGYQSGFFHGAPNGSMGFDAFANLAGFQNYYGKTEYNNNEDFDGIWGIWDDKFFQFYAQKLSEFEEPFLGALFSVSSHHPYNIPKDFNGKLIEGPTPLHQCVNYTDQSLRLFFETASKKPWYKNTLFVITADHTPSEPYYKEYQTASGLFKVPIIFYHPSENEWANSSNDELVQQIDITPSILGYLNYSKPYFGFGRNIFNKTEKPYVINYQANTYQYFTEKFLYQYDDNEDKLIAKYNLEDDKYLNNNLVKNLDSAETHTETLPIKAFIQQYNDCIIQNKMSYESYETPIVPVK